MLLANLDNPPPLGELAQKTGLSVNSLKYGFFAHYGRSIYCFFLDECIKENANRLGYRVQPDFCFSEKDQDDASDATSFPSSWD